METRGMQAKLLARRELSQMTKRFQRDEMMYFAMNIVDHLNNRTCLKVNRKGNIQE